MILRQDPNQRTSAHRIAAAGRALFLQRGYRATTMADIAGAADVAIQTIYNVVGSKSAVLNLVFDEAVSGGETPRPVPEFMRERTSMAADASSAIEVIADWFVDVHQRTWEMHRMIREAAAVDPEVAAFESDREQRRLANYALAARMLAEKNRGQLRLGEKEAAAAIWAIGHPRVYMRLVLDGDWSSDRYRTWATSTLKGALLSE